MSPGIVLYEENPWWFGIKHSWFGCMWSKWENQSLEKNQTSNQKRYCRHCKVAEFKIVERRESPVCVHRWTNWQTTSNTSRLLKQERTCKHCQKREVTVCERETKCPHIWCDWEKKEEFKIYHGARWIGISIRQERICTECNKLEVKMSKLNTVSS